MQCSTYVDVNNSGETSCAPEATGTRRHSSQCKSVMLDSLVGILTLNCFNSSALVVDARDSQETPSTSQKHSRLSQMNSSDTLNLNLEYIANTMQGRREEFRAPGQITHGPSAPLFALYNHAQANSLVSATKSKNFGNLDFY